MEKKWLISINSKYTIFTQPHVFNGTDKEAKQLLVDLCNEDREDENQELAEYEKMDPIHDFVTIEHVKVNDIKNGFILVANFREVNEYGEASDFECTYQAIDLDMIGEM